MMKKYPVRINISEPVWYLLNAKGDIGTEIENILENIQFPVVPRKLMRDMHEPELSEHLSHQLKFIKACQTEDTIGSMLIIFQDDEISQYGATVDPETAPQALRELADRIEKRQTVKR